MRKKNARRRYSFSKEAFSLKRIDGKFPTLEFIKLKMARANSVLGNRAMGTIMGGANRFLHSRAESDTPADQIDD